MNWQQPCCPGCYKTRHGRVPVHVIREFSEIEQCCYCGESTADGIYVRADPRHVPFPTEETRHASN